MVFTSKKCRERDRFEAPKLDEKMMKCKAFLKKEEMKGDVKG